ncbi:MAG TPA: threonine/serine dehydratase [Gemmatimonadales bacterium]
MTSAGELLYNLDTEVTGADHRIRPYVRETALDYSPELSRAWGAEIFLKLENTQVTGSFKVRGAINRLLSTPISQRALGVVAASTGNHGAAVAYAMAKLNIPGTVYVPTNASPSKLNAIRAWGAEVRVHGEDGLESELEARRYSEAKGLIYLSPYNDPYVVAGQGTIGAELARQLDRVDVVCISVGGGGLIGGVAGFLKGIGRQVTVVGCSPEHSKVMYESVKAGQILELASEPTLSDGTAGGVEPGAITFPLCRALVDEWALLNETEIAEGIRLAIDHAHQLVEGSAGMALAAARRLAGKYARSNIVVVLCGGNISAETLKQVL